MICKNCQKSFDYLPQELSFYDQRGLSYPLVCPVCRQLYRYASRNEYYLYKRQCDKCKQDIVSYYSPDKPYQVYCSACYWSDDWDGLDYGTDYDQNKSVFDHLRELHLKVPHLATRVIQSRNSDYTNSASYDQDCYFSFRIHYSEGVFNSYWGVQDRDCFDCLKFTKNELLYQCVDCHHSYNCQYCLNCQNCLDCIGCVDCHNCQSCYLSSNLRNQKYFYKNKQLGKEEYEKTVQPLFSAKAAKELARQWQEVIDSAIYSATNKINCLNCYGDNMLNCKDCYAGFEVIGCENSIYISDALNIKDSLDVYSAGLQAGSENIYNSWGTSNNCSNTITSFDMQEGTYDTQYSQQCYSGHDLFGCVNLRNKSFCIFNRQYTEEEYLKLRDKIISRMKADNNYGEFQSPAYSLFGYNESPAQFYRPLSREEVLAKGWRWKEKQQQDYFPATCQVPPDIREVNDEITKEVLACSACGRNYKIISHELNFYRQMNLPVPEQCFYCRHAARIKLRNPFSLHKANCVKCGQEIDTAFPLNTKKRIYCEECYRKEIY